MSDDGEEVTDLAVVLAPLSKEQLEFLIAKLVASHEELGDEVLQLARMPVSLEPIQQAVVAAMEMDESQQIQELQVLLSQARDYAAARDAPNAIAVGRAVTAPFVDACPDEDGEDLQCFFREMEETWEAIAEVSEGAELDTIEGLLNGWKKTLTKRHGPIFSDTLRAVAKRRRPSGAAAGGGTADGAAKRHKA